MAVPGAISPVAWEEQGVHDEAHPPQPGGPGKTALAFLAGGGEMGSRIRAFDWAATPVGPVDCWPAALRHTLPILLSTNHPVVLFWGAHNVCFYNDAYSNSLGPEQHPAMPGTPMRQAWPEIWHVVEPEIEHVMSGRGATWHENQRVPMTRNGRLEEAHWTYSYGPMDDETAPGGIGGALVLFTETNQQVQAMQHSQAEHARWLSLFDQAPGIICVLAGPEHRYEYANGRYQAMVQQRAAIGHSVAECLPGPRGARRIRQSPRPE